MKARDLLDGRILTFSNFLSASRVILFPVAAYALYLESVSGNIHYRYYALLTLLVMVASDIFDGFFARLFNQVSRLGQFLDPVADKIATAGMAFVLYYFREMPLWIVVVIVFRDMINIYGGFIMFHKRDIQVRSNLLGKILVGILALSGFIFIASPGFDLFGITFQDVCVGLIMFFAVMSNIAYWNTYSYLYLNRQR